MNDRLSLFTHKCVKAQGGATFNSFCSIDAVRQFLRFAKRILTQSPYEY